VRAKKGGELSGLVDALGSSQAALFDFDGVIADSEPFYRDSYNEALAGFGLSIEPEEYWLCFTSLGQGLEGYLRRHGIDGVDIESVKAAQRTIYAGYCRRGSIPLFPGAPEILGLMSSHYDRPWAIASNSDPAVIADILRHAAVPLPLVVGGAGLDPKPSPAIFLEAARRLGVAAAGTLVFEDAWKGLEAARAGGFRSVLVRGPLNRSLDLEADFEIEGISSLAPLIGRRT
jgi:beta-phosphoglucomutase-like phosphatase (HAD superfamily)